MGIAAGAAASPPNNAPVRFWTRKPRQEERAEPKPQPAKRPKTGEDLRKAFLERLESRAQDEEA